MRNGFEHIIATTQKNNKTEMSWSFSCHIFDGDLKTAQTISESEQKNKIKSCELKTQLGGKQRGSFVASNPFVRWMDPDVDAN